MSPDSVETRIQRLEQKAARMEQQLDDLKTDVRVMAPLTVQMAELRIHMDQVNREVHECHESVILLRRESETSEKERQNKRSEELRDTRNFRRTLVGIGIAAMLSPVGTLIVALASQ